MGGFDLIISRHRRAAPRTPLRIPLLLAFCHPQEGAELLDFRGVERLIFRQLREKFLCYGLLQGCHQRLHSLNPDERHALDRTVCYLKQLRCETGLSCALGKLPSSSRHFSTEDDYRRSGQIPQTHGAIKPPRGAVRAAIVAEHRTKPS